MLIEPLRTDFREILIEFYNFSFTPENAFERSSENNGHFSSASMC